MKPQHHKQLLKPIGLFFGSFNPIHNGHLMLANYLLEFGPVDEIWFIVSPHNPLKEKKSLLHAHDRYDLVSAAIEQFDRFKISDIEFHMPQPSYTIDTLTRLSEQHPDKLFYLICGNDALAGFKKWKNYEQILEHYRLLVYPRHASDGGELATHPSVQRVDAPMIEVSSSFIREAMAAGKDLRYFLPAAVNAIIEKRGLYK
jgi:nicotinate-nucleotide adenylyltransferase